MHIIILICLSIFIAQASQAATYYVSTTGSNSNSCSTAQNINTPKLTIASGITCLSAGDTLNIRDGTYTESIINSQLISHSGTSWTNAVTIQAHNSETVTLSPGSGAVIGLTTPGVGNTVRYIIFKNLVLDANNSANVISIGGGSNGGTVESIRFDGIEARNASSNNSIIYVGGDDGQGNFTEILNSTIHDNGTSTTNQYHGVYVTASNILVEHTEIYDISGYGIHNYGESALPSNNIYRYNKIYDSGNNSSTNFGIIITSGSDNIAYNNLIYNTVNGVEIGGSQNLFFNNTIYGVGITRSCGGFCYPAIRADSASGEQIRNNILYNNNSNTISGNGTLSNNLCQSAGTGCSHTGNPNFVAAGSGDFHIQSSSTAAIDQGATIVAVTDDFDGVERPQGSAYDIGAYEFVQADTTDPVVEITSPTSNTTYTTATTPITTIAGTATDAVGTTSITWSNTATSGSGSGSGCSGETSCNWSVSSISLNEGANVITITGADAAANEGTDTITVTLDTIPPSRSTGSPSGTLAAGTASTSISLDTNEAATCKYGTSAGVSYASQPNIFSLTNSTSHSTTVSSLSNGNSYTYYVRCKDALDNANGDDFSISFSIDDVIPVFLGQPSSLSQTGGSTPTFLGQPSSLSQTGGSTPTFLGNPSNLNHL